MEMEILGIALKFFAVILIIAAFLTSAIYGVIAFLIRLFSDVDNVIEIEKHE